MITTLLFATRISALNTAQESYNRLTNALAAAEPPSLFANFLSEAPDGIILEQSCRLSTSLSMTANRFQASVNAIFQALVSPSANSFHFFCV